jgi:sugar lactone lactonase YvrE
LPNGTVRILAYFANNITSDSTPTCVAQGPDGALYIGTLSLVDSLVFGPSAIVYRVDPARLASGGAVPIIGQESEWATGLWPINGCAFGPDGSLYVSELITSQDFSGGDVVKIPFHNPASHISLTNQTLPFAAGVAVARDGTVYAVGLTVTPNGFVARLANR